MKFSKGTVDKGVYILLKSIFDIIFDGIPFVNIFDMVIVFKTILNLIDVIAVPLTVALTTVELILIYMGKIIIMPPFILI